MPFHIPLRQQHPDSEHSSQLDEPTEQLCEQVSLRCHEEGYDLADNRYHTHMAKSKRFYYFASGRPEKRTSTSTMTIKRYEFFTVPKPAHESVAFISGKTQVLTSASFLQSLVGKEQMKKEAAEEKERWKIEWEEKRTLKENTNTNK